MREEDFPGVIDRYTYLDNACMSLRPERVIEKVEEYYREYPGCPGRSNHQIGEKVGSEVEKSREKVARFIDAAPDDLVFTSGTTESINMVAQGLDHGKVFVSDREHNSNLLPWQNRDLNVISTENGFDMSKLESELQAGDLVSLVHVSNLDGYEIPVEQVSELVRQRGAYLLVDAAQSVPHQQLSVKDIRPDFVAFSGHKMLGPSGTGALYVSDRVKDKLQPSKLGGGAVNTASYRSRDLKEFPRSMESGLPNVSGISGLGEAVSYLKNIGMENVERQEEKLSRAFRERVEDIEGVEMLNPEYDGVFSLMIEGVDVHEASLHMDKRNIAVRSGQHCVHSYFDKLDIDGTLRLSFYFYNNEKDVKEAVKALEEIAFLGQTV